MFAFQNFILWWFVHKNREKSSMYRWDFAFGLNHLPGSHHPQEAAPTAKNEAEADHDHRAEETEIDSMLVYFVHHCHYFSWSIKKITWPIRFCFSHVLISLHTIDRFQNIITLISYKIVFNDSSRNI